MGYNDRIPEFSEHYSLRIALSGEFSVNHGSYRSMIDSHTYVLSNSGHAPKCYAVAGQQPAWLYVGFTAGQLEETARMLGIDDYGFMEIRYQNQWEVLEQIRNFVKEASLDTDRPHHMRSISNALLREVLKAQLPHEENARLIPAQTVRRQRDLYSRLQRVREFIDVQYMYDPTIDILADVAHLSRSHFLRLYKAAFGSTPHQDLLDIKLKAACVLLGESGRSVTEVSEHAGFGNRCAFSRVFNKRYGMSPREYRKMKLEE